MKTAISIPDPLAEATDRLAARLGLSRSGLIQLAVRRLLDEYEHESVTEKLNQVYASAGAEVDPILDALQSSIIDREDWD